MTERLVICTCRWRKFISQEKLSELVAHAEAEGREVEYVDDLCELMEKGDEAEVSRLAKGTIAACHKRAVRSLLLWRGVEVKELIDLRDKMLKEIRVLNNLPVFLPVHFDLEEGPDNLESKTMYGLDSHRFTPLMELFLNLFSDAGIKSAIEDIVDTGNVFNAFHQRCGLTGPSDSIDDAITGSTLNELINPLLGFCGLECHIMKNYWSL